VSGHANTADWVSAYGPIGRELIYLVVGTIGWLSLVLLLDSGLLGQFVEYILSFADRKLHSEDQVDSPMEDEDVRKEREKAAKCLEAAGKNRMLIF